MIYVTNILAALLFLCWAAEEGIREAYYYHEATKNNYTIKINLHSLFYCQRLSVFVLLFYFGANIITLLSFVFMFSFIHDGIYYWHRNLLDENVYPKKFFDNSTTSTAFFEFTFKWRLIHFIIGVLLFTARQIYAYQTS